MAGPAIPLCLICEQQLRPPEVNYRGKAQYPTRCELYCPCFFPWVYSPPKTTQFLKYKHVLRKTSGKKCAYVNILREKSNGTELVGPATVFVSHAYDYRFLDAVDAICEWAHRNPRADGSQHFFYFDLFINSQHGDSVTPFEELRDRFAGDVISTERLLLLLTDFDIKEPIVLSRSWCIFEIAIALNNNIPFEVIMPPFDEKEIHKAFLDGDEIEFNNLIKRLCEVNTERAQAKEPDDQKNIQRMIKNELGGFLVVNRLVISAMRNWTADMGLKILEHLGSIPERIGNRVIRLLNDQGRFSEAESVCRIMLLDQSSMHKKELIPEYVGNRVIHFLNDQGRFNEAESVFRIMLLDQSSMHKEEFTADMLNHDTHLQQDNFLRKRLRLMQLESLSSNTLLLSKILYYQQKELESADVAAEADTIALQAKTVKDSLERDLELQLSIKNNGLSHPETLTLMHNIAEIESTNNAPLSVEYYLKVLEGRLKILGPNHPNTLLTERNLKSLLESLGRIDELQNIHVQPQTVVITPSIIGDDAV